MVSFNYLSLFALLNIVLASAQPPKTIRSCVTSFSPSKKLPVPSVTSKKTVTESRVITSTRTVDKVITLSKPITETFTTTVSLTKIILPSPSFIPASAALAPNLARSLNPVKYRSPDTNTHSRDLFGRSNPQQVCKYETQSGKKVTKCTPEMYPAQVSCVLTTTVFRTTIKTITATKTKIVTAKGSTISTTRTVFAPEATFYAACDAKNFVTLYKGQGFFQAAFILGDNGPVSASSAYECCVACLLSANCGATIWGGGQCFSGRFGPGGCDPKVVALEISQLQPDEVGYTAISSNCGSVRAVL